MQKIQPVDLIIKCLESILVIAYILFEELIWKVFALPIYQYVKDLTLLHSLAQILIPMQRHVFLLLFILLLLLAETLGFVSGLLFIEGYVFSSVMLYLSKIPIAALTFWMFELCKDKLMSFYWVKVLYDLIMHLIDGFVQSSIYLFIKSRISTLRVLLKQYIQEFRGSSALFVRLKSLYANFKAYLLQFK